MTGSDWRAIVARVRLLTGRRYPHLEREVEEMEPEIRRDFAVFLKDVEQVLAKEKRASRWFPGGPEARV